MNYIDLPRPHGYLIWRGKQKAIASPTMLPVGEKLLVVSEDEAYGEVVLSSPAKVSISELEKREEGYHCLRPETRKLLWPEAESFFIHEFKEWQGFEAARMVDVTGDTVEFIEARTLSEAQKQLLEKANRLPKTIVLVDDAVVWSGDKAVIQDGLGEKVKPILDVVLQDARSDDLALPLYQLALVRAPRFRLEKKSPALSEGEGDKPEAEKAMPYKAQMDHPDCEEEGKPVGLVNKQTGKLMGCHEDMEAAMAQAEAIMAGEEDDEDKGKTSSSGGRPPKKAGRKKELAEGEKYDDMMMSMPMMGGATSFADMMAMEEAHEAMMETSKLTSHFGLLASNIMASPDITDKGAALKKLAEEYAGLVGETMGHKAAGYEEGQKPAPEVTENTIRVRVRNPDSFQKESFRTIQIDKSRGIQAVIGKPEGESSTTIQAYIFDKDEWTPQKARAWVDEHESEGGEKAITGEDKRVLTGEIHDLPMRDVVASHRRLHQMAARGAILTGFSQADMGWYHAQLEDELKRRAGEDERKPSEASPLEWGNKADDDDEMMMGAADEKHHAARVGVIAKRERGGKKAGRRMRSSMMDKLKAAWSTIKEIMDWAEEPMMDGEEEMMGLAGFSKGYGIAIKEVNGEPWLITYSTNAFQDREKEIFSTKSLERYVTQAEKQNDRGYFNLWHIATKENPGLSDIAEIKWQGVVGRFLVEAGPFLKNEKGQAALEFFKKYSVAHPDVAPEGWGCSPEYRYLPEERKTGIYENIWKTRTSILPRLAAANIWTKAGVEMALSEQQKQAASAIFGEELAGKIIKSAEDATKELEEAGVAHKGEAETTTTGEAVTVTQTGGLTREELVTELQPFAEAMNIVGEQLAKLQARQDELAGQVKSLEKTEQIKANTETPRATLFSFKRASEAPQTVVAEDDALKNKKPAEMAKPPADTSGAAHFFPAR